MTAPAEVTRQHLDVSELEKLVEEVTQRIATFVAAQGELSSCDGSCRHVALEIMDVDPLATMVTALDEAADKLHSMRHHILASIHKEENRLIPINKLPMEILGRIFEAIVGDRSFSSPHKFRIMPSDPRNSVATRLMSVCNHWRMVVEESPSLWSTIVTQTGEEAEEHLRTLRRARGMPLEVRAQWIGRDGPDLLDELGARCGQLAKFHAVGIDSAGVHKLTKLDSDAPLLTSLCVISDYEFELPLLFNGNTPSLKWLTLGYVTRFSGNKFSNLTHLRLCDQNYREVADVLNILAVLQRSPALEEYVMENADMGLDIDLGSAFLNKTISLPMLKHLSWVSCSTTITFAIMHLLELSSSTLALNLYTTDWLEHALLAHVRSTWKSLQNTFTTLHLYFGSNVLIAASRASAVRLGCRPFYEEVRIRDIFYRPRQVFHYGDLQSLSLLGDEPLIPGDSHLWREIFADLLSLTKLFLRLSSASTHTLWLEALTTRSLGPGPYPAPMLQELCIVPPKSLGDNDDLLSFLVMDRHRSGHPLRTLRVVHEKGVGEEEDTHASFMFWKGQRNEYERYVHDVRFEEHTGSMPGLDIPLGLETWDWTAV